MRDCRIFYAYLSGMAEKNAHEVDLSGKDHSDPFTAMTVRLLSASGLSERLKEKTRKTGKTRDTLKIMIKPNLVSPVPAEYGATTHPEIVAGIIEYLQENGYTDITIAEGSWVGDSTADSFLYCGYEDLARRYGVALVDTKKEPAVNVGISEDVRRRMIAAMGDSVGDVGHPLSCDPMSCETDIPRELKVCRCALETDFLINVPVLKGHCQTRMTCALKNMKGLIPDIEKRHFHAMGLHLPIALLNTLIHQDFIVIDHICGDPEFEDGGNPLIRNCVMAAYDPVIADTAACEALGVDPRDVGYLRLSAMSDGGFPMLEKIYVEGEPCEAVPDTHRLLDVSYAVDEVESCSACYSVLIGALDRIRGDGLFDKLTEKIGIERKCSDESGTGLDRSEVGSNSTGLDRSEVGSNRIGIGQGCRGRKGKIGVGNCTSGYDLTVGGCPPKEDDVYEMLRRYCENG